MNTSPTLNLRSQNLGVQNDGATRIFSNDEQLRYWMI